MNQIKDMPTRVRNAWLLLILCVINWPLSLVWYAKEEPPFVLSLSWLALILTCIDIIQTTNVREDGNG